MVAVKIEHFDTGGAQIDDATVLNSVGFPSLLKFPVFIEENKEMDFSVLDSRENRIHVRIQPGVVLTFHRDAYHDELGSNFSPLSDSVPQTIVRITVIE